MPRTGVDYADYNITVYREPCPYRCKYCWAWRIPLFKKRIMSGKYDPVWEAEKLRGMGRGKVVVVSFTSDPYPPQEINKRKTHMVLYTLSNTEHKVLVLTKNPGLAILLDGKLMMKSNNIWLGTTAISLYPNEFEGGAPPPKERLYALEIANRYGIHTWLSIEPIIPHITLPELLVRFTSKYIDWYVFGRLNYPKRLGFKYDEDYLRKYYREEIPKAIEVCEMYGKPYYVKKELRKLVPELPKGVKISDY